MKFGKYLEAKSRPEWREQYINYKALKDLIKASAEEAAEVAARQQPAAADPLLSRPLGRADWSGDPSFNYSPRTTSLTVVRTAGARDTAEERFFKVLEGEVAKVGRFTDQLVAGCRGRLGKLQERASSPTLNAADRDFLLKEAKSIGDDFLAVEKYVNLNYMGFHKILKKHDKMLPHAPCRQFYIAHLHNQPWVQGNYSDLLVVLSACFSQLRGDQLADKQESSAQAFKRSTTKYWIRTSDVSEVKRRIIEAMPVFVFNKANYSGDAQLVNSVYFDNSSLELYHGRLDKKPGAIAARIRWYGPNDPKLCFIERKTHRESWKGEKSVKERFTLPEDKVVPYLEGEYTVEDFREDLAAKGKSEGDIEKAAVLFSEIYQQIDSKQLKPFIRTQYMRSAFQMGHDRTVSFTLDTNLVMIKENPEGYPSCAISGRWYRDPKLPIQRSEVTRFPHAVLEVKLALPEGERPPLWVQDLIQSGLLTEVHKMSKFIHGTAVLFPDQVQAVPYWIDDESLRASILASAPAHERPGERAPPRDSVAIAVDNNKPRRRGQSGGGGEEEELRHPLLGDAPTLQLISTQSERDEAGGGGLAETHGLPGLFSRKAKGAMARSIPQRLEPKTFLASERTFLSWLHMAITLGAIAAALLSFSATAEKHKETGHPLTNNIVEVVALIMLPLAIFICAYALMVFLWRNSQIAQKQAAYIDDHRHAGALPASSCVAPGMSLCWGAECGRDWWGPLLLSTLVVTALGCIFALNVADLVDQIKAMHKHDKSPSPAPAPPAPLSFLLPGLDLNPSQPGMVF
ncbi:hypothetical protein N2152v2_001986 [Parachlorella kessleri]